ncbi:MAG: RNA polymerase sigma factor, partial [Acidimicrobiales bacterium]|nr:RNA polymerase sigma factor [Acidimicrobiales bacterium]
RACSRARARARARPSARRRQRTPFADPPAHAGSHHVRSRARGGASTACQRSIDALLAAHHASVGGVCRRILIRADLAQDAAQRTFIRLWLRTGPDVSVDDIETWLHTTAARTALDLARNLATRERAEAACGLHSDATVASSTHPNALACRAELRAALADALEQLPERQRTIARLRLCDGLTSPEIAALLDLAAPTVRAHYARARRRLQAALARFRDQCADCTECNTTAANSIFL